MNNSTNVLKIISYSSVVEKTLTLAKIEQGVVAEEGEAGGRG